MPRSGPRFRYLDGYETVHIYMRVKDRAAVRHKYCHVISLFFLSFYISLSLIFPCSLSPRLFPLLLLYLFFPPSIYFPPSSPFPSLLLSLPLLFISLSSLLHSHSKEKCLKDTKKLYPHYHLNHVVFKERYLSHERPRKRGKGGGGN